MRLLLREIMASQRNTKDFDRVRLVLKIGQKDFFMMLLEKIDKIKRIRTVWRIYFVDK